MRVSTTQHQLSCGIDLHARTMSLCIVHQEGEMLVHRHMPAGPDPCLKTLAPYREQLVVCVACLFTWYWLADLCARDGMPVVLGHALSRQAIHGGKAKNDPIDAQKIAGWLRGGLRPQAYVSPAAMRATRALLRRRPLMRKRAERLAPIHKTHRQSTLPESGKQRASNATRDGGAERCPAPAVQKSLAVDLALLDHDDPLRRDGALAVLTTAHQHDATPRSRLRMVPGLGVSLSLVLRYAIQDIPRFPRVPDCVSSCRLITCAKASAGKRSGTSGTKLGTADLPWAFAEAAVLFVRANPAGPKSLTRFEKKPGTGTALTI